jgi:hypothetical protein
MTAFQLYTSLGKIVLLSITACIVLFFCLVAIQKKKRGSLENSEDTEDLIDLSAWVSLPEKDYAEKVWSLLEERAFPTKNDTQPSPAVLLTQELPEEEKEEVLPFVEEESQTKFHPYQASVLQECFKKYIYNNESALYYYQEDGSISETPLGDPALLQIWFKKYIYNAECVFYYLETGETTPSLSPLEEPSLLQIWYRTYIYNPTYSEILARETFNKKTQKNLDRRETSSSLAFSSGEREEKRKYIRSNGYRCSENEEILYLPPLDSSGEKKCLQEEVENHFSEFIQKVGPRTEEEEKTIWGEALPSF